ncbi:MAG: hypothetical protein M1827_003077 [Pycnora praestabilis]|nr:MAG: hypothetical protein M1827_003077 [Pycnora praestabilis]
MSEPSASPFLRLPLELRDEVYRLLLIRDWGIHIEGDPARNKKPFYCANNDVKLTTALTLANRQIGKEASRILYSENIFSFLGHLSCIVAAVKSLLPHTLVLLRKVQFQWYVDKLDEQAERFWRELCGFVGEATSLESVMIESRFNADEAVVEESDGEGPHDPNAARQIVLRWIDLIGALGELRSFQELKVGFGSFEVLREVEEAALKERLKQGAGLHEIENQTHQTTAGGVRKMWHFRKPVSSIELVRYIGLS